MLQQQNVLQIYEIKTIQFEMGNDNQSIEWCCLKPEPIENAYFIYQQALPQPPNQQTMLIVTFLNKVNQISAIYYLIAQVKEDEEGEQLINNSRIHQQGIMKKIQEQNAKKKAQQKSLKTKSKKQEYGDKYMRQLLGHYPHLEEYVSTFDDHCHDFITTIRSKTILEDNFDEVERRNTSYEHCLAYLANSTHCTPLHPFYPIRNHSSIKFQTISEILPEEDITYLKLDLMRLDHPIDHYTVNQYLRLLHHNTMQLQGMKDQAWNLQIKPTHQEFASHLKYNIKRVLPIYNRELSINDNISLCQGKFLFHFMQKYLCDQPGMSIRNSRSSHPEANLIYCLQIQVDKTLLELYQANTVIFFIGVIELTPFQQTLQSKQKQPSASLNETMISMKIYLKEPKRHSFAHMCNLYLLPYYMFVIKSVSRLQNGLFIELEECLNQNLIEYCLHSKQELHCKQEVEPKNKLEQPQQIDSGMKCLKQVDSLESKIHIDICDQKMQKMQFIKALQLMAHHKNEEVLSIHEDILVKSNTDIQGVEGDDGLQHQYEHAAKLDLEKYSLRRYYEQYCSRKLKQYGHHHHHHQIAKDEEEDNNKKPLINQQLPDNEEEDILAPYVLVPQSQISHFQKILTQYSAETHMQKLSQQLDIDDFTKLRLLNLSFSKLTRIQHMNCFPNLTQLFLYSNQITKIEGLTQNLQLRVLALNRNAINVIQNLEHLVKLRKLYLSNNGLSMNSVQYLLKHSFNKSIMVLSISFNEADGNRNDDCLDKIFKEKWTKIRKIVINESDHYTSRCKKRLIKKFAKGLVQFFPW